MATAVLTPEVRKVVDRLAKRFPRTSRERITETVREEFDSFAGSPIRTYLPNLVEHSARARLSHE
jgi:hypothetical protein